MIIGELNRLDPILTVVPVDSVPSHVCTSCRVLIGGGVLLEVVNVVMIFDLKEVGL